MARTAHNRRWERALVVAGACAGLVVLAGCSAEAVPSASPIPPPTPTPVPTATPLPGLPLPARYRPEGTWEVSFSRPGDIVREVYTVVLKCPSGACDAIVRVADADGRDVAKGTLELHDDRYVYESVTTRTVDCGAGAAIVPNGATERVETRLVIATYRVTGTAHEEQAIQGARAVIVEPATGSACQPSTTVYPAAGERIRDTP